MSSEDSSDRSFDDFPKEWWLRLGHDLRAPITPIRLAVQLLLSGQGTLAEQRSALLLVDRQIDRLLANIEDVSDLVRLNAGTYALRMLDADLNMVVDAVSARSGLTRELQEKQQVLRCRPSQAVVMASHDSRRLTELLDFLIRKSAAHAAAGALLTLELREFSGSAQLHIVGADESLNRDPEIVHVTGLAPGEVQDLEAKPIVMQEVARLHGISFSSIEGVLILSMPALR